MDETGRPKSDEGIVEGGQLEFSISYWKGRKLRRAKIGKMNEWRKI